MTSDQRDRTTGTAGPTGATGLTGSAGTEATAPAQRRHARTRRRLGEVLVEQGILTAEKLEACLALQGMVPPGAPRRRLGTVVVAEGLATEAQLAHALAGALDLPLVDLTRTPINPETVRTLPRAVAERCGVLVMTRQGRVLTVATADPTNVVALDDVRMYTGAGELTVLVAPESQIREQLRRSWSLSEDSRDVSTLFEDLDADPAEDSLDERAGVSDAPVVRMVDVVLADAVRAHASDIHVEPGPGGLRIRYRVDGLLRDLMTIPRSAQHAVVSRLKIVSGLDIAERRRPQDGRARITVDGATLDARVSTLPSMHGEKVVIRLLPGSRDVPRLPELGLSDAQLETVLTNLVTPQGLVLITGPTGSGKTNTLYASLAQLNSAERNIVTLEDPVEVQVEGVTQVQVHERSGLTFARGLRSVLRQDPDVVLVGEIRDTETAELALRASMTGHLVLSTLHTNDAVSAVSRLVDMGVEPFLVASSLSLVVGQRLVRRPCAGCAVPYLPSPRTLALLGLVEADLDGALPVRGRGCSDCSGTGHRGRTGVFEVLPVTAAVRRVLLSNPTVSALSAAARAAGMVTLRAAGIAAAGRGETTYEEVLRVTHVDQATGRSCTGCARGLGEDMVACPWCGTDAATGHCTGCSRALEAGWRLCPWCRTTAADTAGPSVAPPAAAPLPSLLVVDDDPSVVAFVTAALDGTARVSGAGSATEALALCAAHRYDGVLVDHGLPDLDGTELVRLLRADPVSATVAVAMFTGRGDTESDARRAGADDYLTKPIEPALLEERLLTLLSRARPAPARPVPSAAP